MSLSSPASPANLHVVILAAGKGKRMVSDLPKVLHAVGGRPMLGHVIASAQRLGAARIVVVHGHGSEQVLARFGTVPGIAWAEQAEQLGTGHAVAQALPALPADGLALVLYGDVPLVRPESLTPLLAAAAAGGIGLLTVELPDPTGYGRIVRDDGGRVLRIVEEKDADAATKRIREGNTGILAAPLARLRDWVGRLGNANAQGEYYLTDIIEMAVGEGLAVVPHTVAAPEEVQGVNNRVQLAELERFYQRAQAEALMIAGATLADPARIDVRGEVSTGRDVQIDVNVVFEGRVVLGDRVRIGANCVLRDCTIADDVEIKPFTLIEQAEVGTRAQLGPYARLRPGTVLAEDTHVGNFVELKNSTLAAGAKANHLSYIGDATVGAAVNIGAGTITCNYDGVNKSRTVIGDGAFIGSNSSLIAPVTIGAQATVGAGSAIGKDVPDATLAITRAPQKTITSWKRPEKKT
ncbi:bifunctional UDP-N-acetylglucosamine diphosphorylase/glucosamine-1-phosphate N-acetyltransferase GlmU [Plasticicumulans sp.]|uniref:bifunctional UDP-N-acetylglucosamine diphosphorylase/glucosamine-1-phosphate N-acetyltransferase GlmU n=1 Tax=Plasticicumulans sp. TaxID=2307179 RepID=UPI002C53488D|nr:bifunctional UDP-N-acetylglucosamine diphosphorylase/glucosamine-1-phosphate N-acetyltransferase GlmU [Plasticicumulans sp.]MBS0601382.1 bifunctional UDP-N-acetylglucosamine diphosphorylase/glucosamine-1-phosphate N-acetyltransferase GlmU [Pseudomonadota bacterium]HMV37719.1 bifunctional UDP-N-acetylglucosamine diphosphorylase/glucosamine-1-phosphate N-acetyltransferase GlmU [Plasticicumulans sp.]HMW29367.1 bifunctional UDP-N-acetylglucosamine diphosphorylase/glucosamine-1-phosphate N-acetylt